MSKTEAHHEAETHSEHVGIYAGVPGPLKDAGGDAIPYGWKPRTATTGMFPSAKNGCDVPVHDDYELAFARQAERSPMVEWYETRTAFLLGMLPFDYVPSFAVNLWFGSMVVEITELGMPAVEEEARRAATIRNPSTMRASCSPVLNPRGEPLQALRTQSAAPAPDERLLVAGQSGQDRRVLGQLPVLLWAPEMTIHWDNPQEVAQRGEPGEAAKVPTPDAIARPASEKEVRE